MEEVIAAVANGIYDELLQPVPADRNLREFLTSGAQQCAAVVFDGLSLREVPLLERLAAESRLHVAEEGWSLAAIPSDTVDFVAGRLGVGMITPSQLPACGQLRSAGIAAYHLEQGNQRPITVGSRVAIAQSGESNAIFLRSSAGWVAIELNKSHNTYVWRQLQRILLQPHEKIITLVGFGFGFLLRDFADRECVAFSMKKKLAVPRIAFHLEGGHFLQSSCTDWRFEVDATGTLQQRHFTRSAIYVNGYDANAT